MLIFFKKSILFEEQNCIYTAAFVSDIVSTGLIVGSASKRDNETMRTYEL